MGLSIALWQIRKVRKSADAAKDAVSGAIKTVRTREIIVELTSLQTHIANSQGSINRRNLELAQVHVGLLKSALIRTRELQLRHGIVQIDLEGALAQANALLHQIEQIIDGQAEFSPMPMLVDLRTLADGLEAETARLRYLGEGQEA